MITTPAVWHGLATLLASPLWTRTVRGPSLTIERIPLASLYRPIVRVQLTYREVEKQSYYLRLHRYRRVFYTWEVTATCVLADGRTFKFRYERPGVLARVLDRVYLSACKETLLYLTEELNQQSSA